MKVLYSVVILAVIATVQATLTDEQKAKLKQHQDECLKSFPADKLLLEKARKGDLADNKTLKDYLYCVIEKSGFITPDGKIQTAVLETKLASVTAAENAKKLVAKCTSQKNLDKKESAEAIYKCVYNETKFSLI
ncbi:general odorant-binding protein 56a [Agrilus planipennis]|uniref:General odorant-binding protein 56a n=1 Tax=Agrilus planipennis TaxID=224129 RepID=A0A1W4X7I2_AGRPL|nr:general odorant-binding protein 56a [Agrilus planipennis]